MLNRQSKNVNVMKSKFMKGNKTLTGDRVIANEFSNYCVHIGSTLGAKLGLCDIILTKFHGSLNCKSCC